MALPERVIDMHVHLFNARYLPLDSIIADLIHPYTGRDKPGPVVKGLAGVLWSLTGSSYASSAIEATPSGLVDISEDQCIEAIAGIAAAEAGVQATAPVDSATLRAGRDGVDYVLLHESLQVLATADYDAERIPSAPGETASPFDAGLALTPDAVASQAGWLVRRALNRLERLMDPDRWGQGTRYVRFFLTMLASERKVAAKLFAEYGRDVRNLHAIHFMMDMEHAYPAKTPPYYATHEVRVGRMARLAEEHGGRIRGFAAFDPRDPDWEAHFSRAIQQGMAGFKFYPAMGYLPHDDRDTTVRARVGAFLDRCCAEKIPVFAHCTPEGFETKDKLGYFADPRHWEKALRAKDSRRNLRLCLGHAGGGRVETHAVRSAGWFATNGNEWTSESNYARRAAALCREFPNVYCEMGHLTGLFDQGGDRLFLENFAKAQELPGDCDLLDKVIYGSDWSMPHMQDRPREYLERFHGIATEIGGDDFCDRFFWRNAFRYLAPAPAANGALAQ